MSNIVEVVEADKNLAALGNGLKASGMDELLSKEGPFTVFAPTDLAFGQLQAGKWPEMLKPENKPQLIDLMNNYVVKGKTSFKQLSSGQKLTTLGGKELRINVSNGIVEVNGAQVQGRDIEASNGVIHSIDRIVSMQEVH